jgi:Family of unknown function (DUF5317)
MLDQLLPAVGAALLACAAGGSLTGLARPIRWWPLGLLAIGVELALVKLPGAGAPWLHWVWAAALSATFLLVLRNLWAERGLAWSLAALGIGLNLLVIFANGGYMPVSRAGLEQTGQPAELAEGAFRREVLIDDSTRLPFLADIFVDPSWFPQPVVTSVGDHLLTAGLAVWAFTSVYRGRRSRSSDGALQLRQSLV